MLKDQVANVEMINAVLEMISADCPSRSFISLTLRMSHKATHAQADDAIRAARLKVGKPTLWLRSH